MNNSSLSLMNFADCVKEVLDWMKKHGLPRAMRWLNGYHCAEDAVQETTMKLIVCMSDELKFGPINNPFAYFSKCLFNTCKDVFRKHSRQREFTDLDVVADMAGYEDAPLASAILTENYEKLVSRLRWLASDCQIEALEKWLKGDNGEKLTSGERSNFCRLVAKYRRIFGDDLNHCESFRG